MVRVKVCGISSRDDVGACLSAGVDALGFIFAPSPRHLTVEQAATLARIVPPFVTRVGVFADNEADCITAAIQRCGLDLLQFSGPEPAAFRGSFGKPTIAVVRGPDRCRDLDLARAVALMIDAPGDALGGSGRRVEPEAVLTARHSSPLPFILAGGLTPANVAEAVAAVRPWAVDVRSGVERSDRKDAQLLKRFVAAAKGA